MNFKTFKNNVENWARDRGIYKHSTAEAQLMKALSELGELADGVIKNDYTEIKDAIGDTAVCIVNYAKMSGATIVKPDIECQAFRAPELVGEANLAVGQIVSNGMDDDGSLSQYVLELLKIISETLSTKDNPVNFNECCELAWLTIKDRGGRMVEGGAFVKDEDDGNEHF